MKTLFLEIDTEREWAVASVGPASLAAWLRRAGHEAAMLRVAPADSARQVVEAIRREGADLLGLSLTTRQWPRARDLMRGVRAEIDVPVVAGGLHPTFSPEQVLSSPGFDAVCLGEGEEALCELAEILERGEAPRGIDNLWYRGEPRPRLRIPIEPLDRVPFLARDFLDEPRGVVHMATQRGCPFPCTYCAARNYNELYRDVGRYGRRRSHGNVLAELEALRESRDACYVIFLDDTFTIDRRWVEEMCRLYGERCALPFSIHARVETVDGALLETLAAAGCRHITYGVESGSERVRREIMQRPVTDKRFREVFARTAELGILVTANYMLGLPGETRDDLEMTCALAEELPVTDFGHFVFYPYRGTRLYELCRERGYLPDGFDDLAARHGRSLLSLPDLSPDDIDAAYDRLTRLRERLATRRSKAIPAGSATVARSIG